MTFFTRKSTNLVENLSLKDSAASSCACALVSVRLPVSSKPQSVVGGNKRPSEVVSRMSADVVANFFLDYEDRTPMFFFLLEFRRRIFFNLFRYSLR